MILSDIHIGESGTQDSDYLEWAVNYEEDCGEQECPLDARGVINPLFIVSTGDLTDSTNGGTIPNGPYEVEWVEYKSILDAAGISQGSDFYYDIPGNHDAYGDIGYGDPPGILMYYYKKYSVQGNFTDPASASTQHAWEKVFDFGSYLFIGVDTAGNDGAPFSIWPPFFGDHAGLDGVKVDDEFTGELGFIQDELEAHPDAELTIVFGHHPFEAGYYSTIDTGLTYGLNSFLGLIEDFSVSAYGFGHTHNYRETLTDLVIPITIERTFIL
jgi:hypothetical protein